MKTYVEIFKRHFSIELEYRTQVVTSILSSFIAILTIVVFWLVVYQSRETIGGLTLSTTLIYYSFTPLIGLITRVNSADQMGNSIKDGELSQILVKPLNVWKTYFASFMSGKVSSLLFAAPLYIMVIVIVSLWQNVHVFTFLGIMSAAIICVLILLTMWILDSLMGSLAFFISDIWWFSHFKSALFGIFAGVSFPFEFLPNAVRGIFEFLPFKYLYYVPISYALSNRDPSILIKDIFQILLWAILFMVISGIMWKKGLRTYDAYGN